MIEIYKTNNNKTEKIKSIEKDCWINVTDPSTQEIEKLSNLIGLEDEIISYLDEEEQPRTKNEKNYSLIVLDIPLEENHKTYILKKTIPLIIIHSANYIITMCTKKTLLLNDFINNKVKDFSTEKKSRFIMQIILKVATTYIKELKQIQEEAIKNEKSLKETTSNNTLIKLMNLQKSLVYISTSLRSNNNVLEKLQKTTLIPLYDEDIELLEDAIIENKQAIEMSTIYSSILSSTIEVFGTIISNNLNKIMKFLAGFTIVISVPTIVASFMGMNVPLGMFKTNPYSFALLALISLIISILVALILKKKNML